MSTSPEKTSKKQSFVLPGRETLRYTLFGAIFGLTFPMAGILIIILYSHLPLTLTTVAAVQKTNPLLWIVETAPIFLGLFAFLVGERQDKLRQLNKETQATNRELAAIQIGLENRVAERTLQIQAANRQIESRASRLQTITELSQAIALVQDPDELLPQISRLISERFSFYHVGIFLLDEKREYAVLRSANSEGGQRMLARNHKLKVGGGGIVGFVSQSGYPRVALETGTDEIYFNNPDLPDTRSEVALPLKAGQQVIGVLDVQSAQPSAFNNEDVEILGTLANQVAIVIQNSRLYKQAQSALQAYQATSRRAWAEQAGEKTLGYSYQADGSLTDAPLMDENLKQKTLASNQTVMLGPVSHGSAPSLAIPVKLRNQVIGIIHIEPTEANRKWSENEIAMLQSISERAAFALENARLLENAQRRANREQAIGEITAKIGATTNVDSILRATVLELGRQIGKTEVTIEIGKQVMDTGMEE